MTTFSIIIPTLNEEQFIDKCLASVESLDYPKENIEVIIVDNGSTDQTLSIAKKHNAKIFIKKECNVSELRNFGAQMAVNKIFAFVDADCLVPSHWLIEAEKFLGITGVGAVGCWYKLPDNPTWVEKVWDVQMRERRNKIGAINWIPSGNFIISREIFEKINGFDEALITSEDVDICERIGQTGLLVYSHPVLSIEHLGESDSVRKYFRKESWRGEGVYQNFLRNLPRLKLNKALLFAFLTALLCIGVIAGECVFCLGGNVSILDASAAGLVLLPLTLSFKTLIAKKQWTYLFPLAFLFFLYGIARATSFFKPRIWGIKLK